MYNIFYVHFVLIISLQSYECQGKEVREGRKRELWSDVTPDMMSDEEQEQEQDEKTFTPSSIISKALNTFIAK